MVGFHVLGSLGFVSGARRARWIGSGCQVSAKRQIIAVTGTAAMSAALTALTVAPAGTAQASGSPAGGSDSGWVLSTSAFTNQFGTQPYVGNGYLSQRIPAAGTGFLGGLGTIGWPLRTPRVTDAIAAGVYAYTDASNVYPGVRKQVIALIPTWSTLTFGAPSGNYSSATASAANVSGYAQSQDLRTGTVTTSGTWTAPGRQRARFSYQIFTDRARPHVGVVSLRLTPLWTGRASVTSLLDGSGASRLDPVDAGVDLASHTSHVTSKAAGTGTPVAESATLSLPPVRPTADSAAGLTQPQTAGEQVSFTARAGTTYTFTKYVSVVTGRDCAQPETDARAWSLQAALLGTTALMRENTAAWASGVWDSDITVPGDPALQTAIHASEYGLYASIRPESPDAIGPAGLSSDGYAGMVFWDSDTWMFPAILAGHPDIARADVEYRYRTLAAAEHNAAANGYQGAFYPWTAGDDGRIGADCYGAVTDSGDTIISDPNHSCSQELHLQADIAIAQWEYYEATGDRQWLATQGWPVLRDAAQFWVSKASPAGDGGYAVNNVQPPDESHTGVNNSAYTNAAAATTLRDACAAAQVLGTAAPATWTAVADGLVKTIPYDASQDIDDEFDGYDGAQIKQADVVMLTYPLNFPMSRTTGLNDLNYYVPRTNPAGPAMTDAIHSIDASALNAPGCSAYSYLLRSYEPFLRAPYDQFAETSAASGNPYEAFNFLTGAGGFLQVFGYGFGGLRFGADAVRLDPSLPPQLRGITLTHLRWQSRSFTLAIGPLTTTVTADSGPPLPVETPRGRHIVPPGGSITIPTRRPDLQPTADLVRCQQVTASSWVPGNDPVAAVDGSAATGWVATHPLATLTVRLSRPADICSVTVTRGADSSTDPFGYTVQVSADGTTWRAVGTASFSSTGTDTFTFGAVHARYVRLSFPGTGGAKNPAIAEVSASPP
jgi:trehalose/maltose hydrolase-like predicted phosphorylase